MKVLKNSFLIILFPALLIISCKKDYIVAPLFTGITVTDINAMSIGFIDTTDWNRRDTWQSYERALFPSTPNLSSLCLPDPIYNSSGAYPNPCENIGNVTLRIPPTSLVSIRVVDLQFKIFLSIDNVKPDNQGYVNQSIGFSQLGINDQMVRVYYVITDSSKNCVFKGHGDILVQ